MVAPSNPSPDQILIDAARHYGRRVAGQDVRRLTLTLADGSKRKLEVPPAEDWPPAEGWAVKGERVSCGGRVFRLVGKGLVLLKELIAAGEEGVSQVELKRRVWDERTDDRTVQNAVSKLRAAIRDALELAEDVEPVEAADDRYRLAALA